jgi:hypothetical protein
MAVVVLHTVEKVKKVVMIHGPRVNSNPSTGTSSMIASKKWFRHEMVKKRNSGRSFMN